MAEKSLVNDDADTDAAAAVVAVAPLEELDEDDFDELLQATRVRAVPAAVAASARCFIELFIVFPFLVERSMVSTTRRVAARHARSSQATRNLRNHS
jgi:hypothetical protein